MLNWQNKISGVNGVRKNYLHICVRFIYIDHYDLLSLKIRFVEHTYIHIIPNYSILELGLLIYCIY